MAKSLGLAVSDVVQIGREGERYLYFESYGEGAAGWLLAGTIVEDVGWQRWWRMRVDDGLELSRRDLSLFHFHRLLFVCLLACA